MPKQKGITLPKERRQYKDVYSPDGGLNTDDPSTQIGEKETPDCNEIRLVDKQVSKNTGTTYFGSTDTTPLDGDVLLIDQYYRTDDTSRLLIFTTTEAYWYNPVDGSFTLLSKLSKDLRCKVDVIGRWVHKNLSCRLVVVAA